jgi:RTX calcium-binding nonapeptide repeat (4 copies)
MGVFNTPPTNSINAHALEMRMNNSRAVRSRRFGSLAASMPRLWRWGPVALLAALAAFWPPPAQAADRPPVVCVEGSTTPMLIGDVTNCKIDVPGDIDVFTFRGRVGDLVSIALGDLSFGCISGGAPCPAAELYAPGSTTPLQTFGPGSSIAELTLPVAGTYSIRVSEAGNDQAEDYGLAIERLYPRSPTADDIAFGETASGMLDPAADTDVFVFDAAKDAFVTIGLSDPTFGCISGGAPCPTASIYAPDESLLDTLLASESTNLVLPSDGQYVVRIHEFGIDQIESYGLALDCLTPPPGRQTCGLKPLKCNGLVATITGTNEDDSLTGTPGDDVIVGLAGNDVIDGRGGNDTICGGPGADTLLGGNGDDVLLGDDGDDVLLGGAGSDNLSGGNGRDSLFGGPGDDSLQGDAGDDVLDGGDGTDQLNGGTGNDICQTGDGGTPKKCEITDPL